MAACDTGRDYEHCLALQKKVNDVEEGVRLKSHCSFNNIVLFAFDLARVKQDLSFG